LASFGPGGMGCGRCGGLLFTPHGPDLDSGHSWSFSSINSVVPRSRLPLPQAVRDAERRTGEPGVALLAGVRGENSPHLLGNIEKGKSKNYFFTMGSYVPYH
jgi:hypothetical protein